MSVIPTVEAKLSHISILASLLTKFQNELAIAVASELAEDEVTIAAAQTRKKRTGATAANAIDDDARHWIGFPRNRPFYETLIIKFGMLSRECCGTTINLILEWLPDHHKDYITLDKRDLAYGTREEFTYGAWLAGVNNFDPKNHRHADIVVRTHSHTHAHSHTLDLAISIPLLTSLRTTALCGRYRGRRPGGVRDTPLRASLRAAEPAVEARLAGAPLPKDPRARLPAIPRNLRVLSFVAERAMGLDSGLRVEPRV